MRIRIVDGIPHPCLGSEMQYYGWSVFGECTVECLLISKVPLDEGKVGIARKHPQSSFFEGNIVVVVAIVISDDDATPLKKGLGDVEPNEARGSGDHYDGAALQRMLVIQSHAQSLSYRSRV